MMKYRRQNVIFRLRKMTRAPNCAAATMAFVILLVLGFTACNSISNSKPTEQEIKQAIMSTGAWNPLAGRVELETVEIEQIGYFNAEKKYWPVKAKVSTKQTHQTAVLEFQIFRDDFGKWAARRAERT